MNDAPLQLRRLCGGELSAALSADGNFFVRHTTSHSKAHTAAGRDSLPLSSLSRRESRRSPGDCMNNAETFATLTARLADAERNAKILLQAGSQERYLESYFLIASLELQLERLRNHAENLAPH